MGDLYFGVSTGDGGYEYKPVGRLEHVDLIDYGSMLPRPGEDMYGHFTRVKPETTKLGWVATTEIIWHGNSLYSKFPKKGKRKLRRYNRCRRVSIIRLNKIWGQRNTILQNRLEDYPWEMEENNETN